MNSEKSTSTSLLQRLKSDQASAWEQFVRLYSPLLYFWAQQKMGLSRHEAEDMVQETLLHLLQRMSEVDFKAINSFRGWLRTVLLNKCRDYYRRRTRAHGNLDSEQLRAEQVSDNVQLFSDREYHAFIARRALELMKDQFEETTWRSCWMRVVEGKSARETAELLGTTQNSVHLAKSRVLRKLREELDGLLEI